jgi:galactosamine-6-phosphate isomerase
MKSKSKASEQAARSPVSARLKTSVALDYETLSYAAFHTVMDAIKRKPDMLLCASAGGTPRRTYSLLAEECARRPGRFSRLRILAIDEWAGLSATHPGRCVADLEANLIKPLGIPKSRFVAFRSSAPDLAAECQRVAQWLRTNGPIDLCILGMGTNGHMAMVEPAAAFAVGPHIAKLAPSSLLHPLLADTRPKPKYGLSVGMDDILRSREALLMVSGRTKQAAIERLLQPRITTQFPASFLWLHPNATLLCDEAAYPGNDYSPHQKEPQKRSRGRRG